MEKKYFLDNHWCQCLTLTRGQAEYIATSNVAAERLRVGAPDRRCNAEHQGCQKDWSPADGYAQGHREQVADPHEQCWICQEIGHSCCIFWRV